MYIIVLLIYVHHNAVSSSFSKFVGCGSLVKESVSCVDESDPSYKLVNYFNN